MIPFMAAQPSDLSVHFRCSLFETSTHQQSRQVKFTKAAAERRSADYQPTVWSQHNFLQSLQTDRGCDQRHVDWANALEQVVRNSIKDDMLEPWTVLALIDDVQRMGLGHRFENDIKETLKRYHSLRGCDKNRDWTLHSSSIWFRLMRQHGFEVSEDIFKNFMEPGGRFSEILGNDIEGVLSLYEASYLAFEGEQILKEANTFAVKHLRHVELKNISEQLKDHVSRALEQPQHHRVPWLGARSYLKSYSRRKDANQSLLELAILDFNNVQSVLQKDLQYTSRWCNNVSLGKQLNFARDRPMECFFWAVGMTPEPKFSDCRKALTKVAYLVTIIDDVYDVYGTIDELELFTDAVQRWDVNAVNNLPHYMKLCFLVLYNTVHEMAYETLKEHGENIIPCLIKAWADLCKAFLLEAQWSHNKITPPLEEYLSNGWISVSGVLCLTHAFFVSSTNFTKDALKSLEETPDLLRWPSVIFRLCNDLATSSAELERGETANSILCYMVETGASEEVARDHIRELINTAWRKMNEHQDADSRFPKSFVQIIFNVARIAHFTYQDGDSHGAPDRKSKQRVHELLLEPISLLWSRADTHG